MSNISELQNMIHQLRTELLEAQGYIEELDKKLTQANATAERYREALE